MARRALLADDSDDRRRDERGGRAFTETPHARRALDSGVPFNVGVSASRETPATSGDKTATISVAAAQVDSDVAGDSTSRKSLVANCAVVEPHHSDTTVDVATSGVTEPDDVASDDTESGDTHSAPLWQLLVAVIASWLVSLAILYWQVRDVDFTLPMQNYDSATHNELVRGMLNRGTLSPFGFADTMDLYGGYYPLGFTSLAYIFVTLFGVGIPTGISLAWGIGAAILWPLGCAFFVRALLPDRIVPAALAPVVAMCFGQYPLGLLSFGTLYPYGLASSLLPWLLGATVLFSRGFSRGFPWREALSVLVFAGLILYVQPRVGLIYLLVAVPFLALWWYRRFWRDRKTKLITKAWLPATLLLVTGSALIYAYVRFGDRLFDTSQWRLAPTVMSWPHALGTYLSGSAYVSVWDDIAPDWVLLALSVVAIFVMALKCPNQRWLLAGWVFIGVAFCCAAAGDGLLPRIVSLPWYRQELRIYAAYPVVMVPIICVGLDRIGVWVGRRAGRVGAFLAAALVGICAVEIALFSPQITAMSESIVETSSQPGGLLDEAKSRFYQACVPIVGDSLVAADPWSGAMFAKSEYNINQFFDTFGPQERHWEALVAIGRSNLSLLRDFGVVYVMDLGPIWSDFDPAYEAFWTFHDEGKYSGLEAILSMWDPYVNHSLTLYRILPPT